MTHPVPIRRANGPAALAALFLRLSGRPPTLLDLYCCQGAAALERLAIGRTGVAA
jgi:hypothetical protein